MPFAATWMDLEGVMLSEDSQTEREKYHMIYLICRIQKEMIEMNLPTKQKQIHRLPEPAYGCREEGMGGWDSQGVLDRYVNATIYKMGNQQGPPVQHMELCSMLCGSLDERGVWGRVDTCMCMAEYLHSEPETSTALLIRYASMQNKKVF